MPVAYLRPRPDRAIAISRMDIAIIPQYDITGMDSANTLRRALAGVVLTPLVVTRAPSPMVFRYPPVSAAITSTEMLHCPEAGIVPPAE